MAYFDLLPNHYVWEGNAIGGIDKKLVKNIFRRVVLADKIERYVNSYEAYYIEDGERPETIAYDSFGDAELDWVILLVNNITDPYTQWPMDTNALLEYTTSQYSDPDAIHHWETKEVEFEGAIFNKEGIEVNEDYVVTLPDGTTLGRDQSIFPVTNLEHETMLNEKKRLIGIPDSNFVAFFESEVDRLTDYEENPELDRDGNKTSVINPTAKYLQRTRYRRDGQNISVAEEGVLSGDNPVIDTFAQDFTADDLLVASVTTNTSNIQSTTSTSSTNTATTTTTTTTTTSTSSGSSSSSGSSGSSGGGYGGGY
tara:strand:- start:7547 stop:8479 length:933 start_codon:yes stop_codon:yes gene_type:complete